MPVEKKKSLHHSRSDSDLIHPQVYKLRNGDNIIPESFKIYFKRRWTPVDKSLQDIKSVAMFSSSRKKECRVQIMAEELERSYPWIRVSKQHKSIVGSSGIENKKTYVVIFHSTNIEHQLIRVLVDSLVPRRQELEITTIELPHRRDPDIWSICTTSPNLGPCLYLFGGSSKEGACKEVFRFDLQDPLISHKCNDIKATIGIMNAALSIQIGQCFYVLSIKAGKLVLQKYDLEKNEWALLPGVDDFSKYPSWVINNTSFVPHIVIGCKLHVSLGRNSLAFDTENEYVGWEDSKLFETFWSKSGLSPSDFYGGQVWSVFHEMPATDKPFGFYGRGILVGDTNKNIFIGIHSFSEECQLVAFLLDDMDRVVDSQPLFITDDVLEGVRLVDLGRDGYFGFTHVIFEPGNCKIELVTVKLSRPICPRDSYFLQYSVMCKDIAADHLHHGVVWKYEAFCV